jgi:hypothetical protein
MEILLLVSVIAAFIGQVLLVRYLFLQVGKRLILISDRLIRLETFTRSIGNTLNMHPTKIPPPDMGEKNSILDDDNADTIEFSEYNPLELPKDIKFEVEGGDTAIPPGYAERAN